MLKIEKKKKQSETLSHRIINHGLSIHRIINKKLIMGSRKASVSPSQGGQIIIEMVLLLVLVVGLWGVFTKYSRQKKWFESLVSGPWQSMAGMIESGVWEPSQSAKSKHPNSFNRVVSLKEQ